MREKQEPLFPASKNMLIKKTEDFYLILNPDAPNLMVSDELGRKVFQYCNGQNSAEAIVEEIARTEEIDRANLMEYISSLVKAGFISKTAPIPVEGRPKPESALGALVLHLTEACNLRCKHCFFKCESAMENEMCTEDHLRVVDEFVELGGVSLLLTGGEPFLRKDLLFQIVEHARKHPQINRMLVNTNGTLITQDDARFLAKYDVDVGVSLDGATKATHDFIRGQGVYEKATKTVRMLADEGVNVTIGMTLMKPNVKEAQDLIGLGKELGASSVDYTLLKVSGRAKDNATEIAPSIEQTLAAVKGVLELSKKVEIKTSIAEMELSLKKLGGRKDLCGAGANVLSMSANGDVYPCDALHFGNLRIGNVKDKTLAEMWKQSPAVRLFRDSSVTHIDKCKDCEMKFICGGGCQADSYNEYGSLQKCSPMCPVFNAIYWFLVSKIATEMWQSIVA